MKKTLSFFVLFVFILSSAQECKIKGTVVDSLALPVFDASITAFNKQNEGVGFTYTNESGEFEIALQCNQEYELEVEHISYESFLAKENLTKNKRVQYILKQSGIALEEAVIEARIPIKVKGDTIEYDADSFKTGSEENLEDILKKLPGIEVEDGKVYFQGKQINSITVEGREIFGGNTKLLNKNLPSDVVDKIQLNKKFKQNPFTSSLQDDEQPALNITLKEDKKSLIFGNITLGGDANEQVDAQEKLFYFSPKTDATVITDYNTYGKEVFTNEDYFSFLGGISEFQEEGSLFSLRDSGASILFGSNQNANELSNLVNAVHFGFEPNDKLYMNAFTLLNNNRLEFNTTTNRIFAFGTETDFSRNEQSIFTGLGRFRLDYTSGKSQIKYRLNANYTDNEDIQDVNTVSTLTNNESFRNIRSERKSVGISQKLSYLRSVGDDDNLGIYLRHQYQYETPDWFLNSADDVDNLFDAPFGGLFNLTSQNGIYNLDQQQNLVNNTFQAYSIYNHLITNTSNLKIKLGGNFSWQHFDNELFNFDSTLAESDPETLTNSDFTYTELYADFTYTKKFGKFRLDAGFGNHYFNLKNEGTNYESNLDINRILPHLVFKYEINTNESVTFSYQRQYSLPQVKELSNSFRAQNFFSLYRGNDALDRALINNYSLSYGVFDVFKFFNFYASLDYNERVDNFQSSTVNVINPETGALTQVNQTINSPQNEESYTARFFISKKFNKNYSIRLNGNLNYSDFFTFLNNQLINNKTITHSYTLRNNFKFKKKIESNVGLSLVLNDFQSNIDNQLTNWRPFMDLAYVINKKLLFQADYSYQAQFNNGDFLNGINDLNASIRFKPAKKTYVKFTAGNILNNDVLVQSSFNDNFTQVTTTDVLGRYFILSVRYKF